MSGLESAIEPSSESEPVGVDTAWYSEPPWRALVWQTAFQVFAAPAFVAVVMLGAGFSAGDALPVIASVAAISLLLFGVMNFVPFESIGVFVVLRAKGVRPLIAVVPPCAIGWRDGRRYVRATPRWMLYNGTVVFDRAAPAELRRLLETCARGLVAFAAVAVPLVILSPGWLITAVVVLLALMALGGPAYLVRVPLDMLKTLRAGGLEAERILAVHRLATASVLGSRPSEWDAELVKPAGALSSGWSAHKVPGVLQAHEHALDRGEIEAAGQLLDVALAHIGNVNDAKRVAVLHAAAYFAARYQHDAITARDRMKKANARSLDRSRWLRIEAAVLLAEGDEVQARLAAQAGLECAGLALDRGAARRDEALLREMLAELGGPDAIDTTGD